MSKKSMIITGIVALVVVVVAAVLLLMPKDNARTPLATTPGTQTSSTSVTASGTTPSTTTSTTSSTQNGDLGNGSSTTGTNGTNGSSTTSNNKTPSADKLAVYPALPEPTVPAAAPSGPIAAGKALPRLTSSPKDAISGLKLGQVPEGSSYDIVMRPIGIGPDLPFGSRIAIAVDSAIPIGAAPAKTALTKANVLVLVDTTHLGTVTKGGTYAARVIWLSDGTKLLPVLRLAKLK